jgi:2-oxoglutarate ferredoxin oxidoreductase subunit alpha
MDAALAGVAQVLVVEQNHGGQLLRYLRAAYDLPGRAAQPAPPGPLPLRPAELTARSSPAAMPRVRPTVSGDAA